MLCTSMPLLNHSRRHLEVSALRMLQHAGRCLMETSTATFLQRYGGYHCSIEAIVIWRLPLLLEGRCHLEATTYGNHGRIEAGIASLHQRLGGTASRPHPHHCLREAAFVIL